MIYVYISLRYLRQLTRVCPDVVARLADSLEESVRKNGGTSARVASGWVYRFDESEVGSTFACARFVGDCIEAFERDKDRLSEYFATIEHTEANASPETFVESLSRFDTVILPDGGIFVSPDRLGPIAGYLRTEPIPAPGIVKIAGLTVPGLAREPSASEGGRNEVRLYADFSGDPVATLRNIASSFGLKSLPDGFGKEERERFDEGRKALEVFARFRFSETQPEYRVAACLDYLDLFFSAAAIASGQEPGTFRVRVLGRAALSDRWVPIMERLSPAARFCALEAASFESSGVDTLPEDIADLAWLLYRSVGYLFLDELPRFFSFLGKGIDYARALGGWLCAAGVLADPSDLRSLNADLESAIDARVSARKGALDRKLASFLWTLYEEGRIEPLFPLYEGFRSLGFEVPDSFLANCLYRGENPLEALETVRERFLDPAIAGVVENLERARSLYEDGRHDEASTLAKDVLHAFQRERILSGEYRALSLIALLSLARDSGDDAVVYLEYALENAALMRDPYSELSTRLDMAMAHFVMGNLHFALCALEQAESLVEEHYVKDREVLVLFMKGRISFELGDYRDAELYFQTAASLSSVHLIPESVALCRTWYARALVHQHRFASAEGILADCAGIVPDAWVFLVEAALVSGRALPATRFPDELEGNRPGAKDWTLSSVSWKSGFSIAEDRAFGTSGDSCAAARMYRAMRLYYDARYSLAAEIPAIVANLSGLARLAFERHDPYASMYYFFCYDLGSKSQDVVPADTAGYLSRAFKSLQRRANEIGDNAMRERFMQSPTWNERLYRAARDNMLI
jgi:tetratricopeptide (TPR) repeat protein